ncbi:hypothetical protein BLA60_22395 [Actinophytocola xinjiangensis]|uniref:Histidine kinase/HSP90-like ATPase domain-containing protein n=1 Tax=Actinophytocola xinjiangensis TaxID=485602 RepID=A0A7Z0WK89_9PSEU|nr:ATP-binding protein [Actinophytocola xinjiangensis]OLF08762.1 hypothetical protein BLA60_22395 [Actinophytocola xinjiangensis]
MDTSGGATAAQLRLLSRRTVTVLRTVAVVVAGGAGVAQAGRQMPVVAAVVVGLLVWSAVYARFTPSRWLIVADTGVVAGLCVAQGWVVRAEALPDSTNWVLAVVTITVVGHQWFTATWGGAALTAVLVAAHLVGQAAAGPEVPGGAAMLAMWVFGEAGLSRALRMFLYKAARRADDAVAGSERARRETAVAAARRADEREHLAVLHDTAAATLFAVGTRMVDGTEPGLVRQAARDLDILAAQPQRGDTDLARLLGDVARDAPVTVRLDVSGPIRMPAISASAIEAAAREALTNVARHAGVDSAELVAARHGSTVVVEVADSGRGFDPAGVPAHRHGVTGSITERLDRVGGRARITSTPNEGTVVRLEWPDAEHGRPAGEPARGRAGDGTLSDD